MSTTYPTSYPELNAVLRELVESVQSVLGTDLSAACLQGSFAVGDYDRHSDVDFIIAVEKELSGDQVITLQTMHERIYRLDCGWARHLEGSYFPKDVLRNYSQRGKPLWYLDNGSRSLVQSEHDNTVVVRWVVREHGVALAGPSPATLTAKNPADREAFTAHWTKILGDDTITIKTILFKGHVAGHILCHAWFGTLEVSYWIGKDFWGRGIATRALAEFLGDLKVRPLYARAAKDNVASIRVLKKCGFTISGEDKEFSNARGQEVEEYILELQ